jgi:hypothetical protein
VPIDGYQYTNIISNRNNSVVYLSTIYGQTILTKKFFKCKNNIAYGKFHLENLSEKERLSYSIHSIPPFKMNVSVGKKYNNNLKFKLEIP